MRAVLTYHSIDASGSPISVSGDVFARHVRWLASRRVRVVPLDELPAVPEREDAVAITFDDGFENFATEAAPALLDNGLPVTLFVVTDRVGTTNEWNGRPDHSVPALRLLGWRPLERLAARGVRLGAHTRTHADLTSLDAAALDDELVGSRECLLERTGRAPSVLAYPYGSLNALVAAHARAVFPWAVTTELRTFGAVEDAARLPRLDMYYFQVPGSLEAWGSPAFTRRLSVRRRLRTLRRVTLYAAGPRRT